MNAIVRQRSDVLFPFPMSALVRLGRVLPTRLRSRILASDLPRLDAEAGATPGRAAEGAKAMSEMEK